jgi:succinate-semialdehyde dehydrogenase/glutarate-semialdehyde dehydrogenase
MGAERYAANFFRWYAEEAVRINGRFTVNEAGTGRVLALERIQPRQRVRSSDLR